MKLADAMRAAKAAQERARIAQEDANAALLKEVNAGLASLTVVVRELGRITGETSLGVLAKRAEREMKRGGSAKRTFESLIVTMGGREEGMVAALHYLQALGRVAEKLKTAEPLKPPWKRAGKRK